MVSLKLGSIASIFRLEVLENFWKTWFAGSMCTHIVCLPSSSFYTGSQVVVVSHGKCWGSFQLSVDMRVKLLEEFCLLGLCSVYKVGAHTYNVNT